KSCCGGAAVGVVEVEWPGELAVFALAQGLPAGLGAVGGFGLVVDGGGDGGAQRGELGQVAGAAAGGGDWGAGLPEGGCGGGRDAARRSRPGSGCGRRGGGRWRGVP